MDLPNEIRTDDVAAHFNATDSVQGLGVMICGSPGEVANDHRYGDMFGHFSGRVSE